MRIGRMKDFFIHIFMAINSFLIRINGGRIGTRLGRQTILLRKSGQPRRIKIAYFCHERKYLIVESHGGKVTDSISKKTSYLVLGEAR